MDIASPSPLPDPARPTRRWAIALAGGALAGAALALPAVAAGAARAAGDGLVFDHAWGRTVLAAPARRVVSLGYTSHDTLLALGVVPVALRHWYGGGDSGIWPWAEPLLHGARPPVLRGEVSMERVAAEAPDLIVAIGAGISRAEYAVLDRIAPTLVHSAGTSPYSTGWREMTTVLGRATGRDDRAGALVAEVEARLAAARARHPGWAGQTAAAAYHWAGTSGAFLPGDARADFLAALGFATPPAIAALAGRGDFFRDLSPEDLSPLDAGVLVWVSALAADPDLAALPMRRTLAAHRQGREVFAGPLASAAMAHASVLSIPFALEALEADLAAAADGDPATPVPSAVAAGLVAS